MNIYIVVDSSGKSNVFFVLIEKFVVYYIAKGRLRVSCFGEPLKSARTSKTRHPSLEIAAGIVER